MGVFRDIAYPYAMGKAHSTRKVGFSHAARAVGQALVAAALPPVCPVTGERVAVAGTLAPAVWCDLTFITQPLCAVSGVPLETGLGPDAVSATVAARPPAYDRARAPLVYDGTGRRLIHQFKYSDRMDLAPLLARLMVGAGQELLAGADMVVPVPLHRRRLIGRRFNQAAILARAVARISDVAERPDLLIRARPTAHQVGLSRARRWRNVAGAFRLAEGVDVTGHHVVLIDDVLTSGATVEACAGVLRRAGAGKIDVLTAARVVAVQNGPI